MGEGWWVRSQAAELHEQLAAPVGRRGGGEVEGGVVGSGVGLGLALHSHYLKK